MAAWLFLLSATALSASPGLMDLAAIDRQVAEFAAASGGQPQPVDPRLRLAQCASLPTLSWYGAQRSTVLVRCSDPRGWKLFVPVLNSMITSAGAASPGGETVVTRGEEVLVTAAGDGFAVTRSGEAQEAGTLGQWIRVRTATGAAPLRARVTGPGEVEINIR